MTLPLLLAIFVVALGIHWALVTGNRPGAVVGTVTYRQRVVLPADAVVEERLQDTSRADAAARTIGQTSILHMAHRCDPFRIDYDPAGIDPSHSYPYASPSM